MARNSDHDCPGCPVCDPADPPCEECGEVYACDCEDEDGSTSDYEDRMEERRQMGLVNF